MGFIQANSIFTKFLGVSMTDKEYMQIAIEISKKSKTPYGTIIVMKMCLMFRKCRKQDYYLILVLKYK